jgi:hypothetical protein
MCLRMASSSADLPGDWGIRCRGGSAALANEFEIDGFRLGMSLATVRQLAIEKGYTLTDQTKNSTFLKNERWVSYAVEKEGNHIGDLEFCDTTLSRLNFGRLSSFHEITSAIKDWQAAYGEPQADAIVQYSEGKQASAIRFKWSNREDNVLKDIMMYEEDQQTYVIFGYLYLKHPCLRERGEKEDLGGTWPEPGQRTEESHRRHQQ